MGRELVENIKDHRVDDIHGLLVDAFGVFIAGALLKDFVDVEGEVLFSFFLAGLGLFLVRALGTLLISFSERHLQKVEPGLKQLKQILHSIGRCLLVRVFEIGGCRDTRHPHLFSIRSRSAACTPLP